MTCTSWFLEIAKHPPSPNWHRRQRARRAQARRIVWQSRLVNQSLRISPLVTRALKLLETHHSQPRYRERMYKNWNQQAKQNWGAWSPQWPKKASKPAKKKEDAAKEQKDGGVLRAYDAAPGGLSSSSSTTSGNAEQLEMQFFKEFVNYVKESCRRT